MMELMIQAATALNWNHLSEVVEAKRDDNDYHHDSDCDGDGDVLNVAKFR